jgi:predicted component of type VI protein secretion system
VASDPTTSTGGRLVSRDGTITPIPDTGLEIGRDPACGLALAPKDVSRRHARIAPALLGYILTDLSANGVRVNGVAIEKSHLLGYGDVIGIGSVELVPRRHPRRPRRRARPRPSRRRSSRRSRSSTRARSRERASASSGR